MVNKSKDTLRLTCPSVLVADDEQAEATAEFISEVFSDAVAVVGASSVEESLKLIDEATKLDLLIVDMNFKSRGGRNGGIQILQAVKARFPAADVLIMTGYSDSLGYSDMLQLADLGVRSSSWLCKGVKDEADILTSRVARMLGNGGAKSLSMAEAWEACRAAESSQAKGDSLESFATVLFESVPGFSCVQRNLRLADQEFDLVLENNSSMPFWSAFGTPFIFVECKNTKKKIEADVVNGFEFKLRQHRSITKLGFIVSVRGFSAGCKTALQRMGSGDIVIVLIGGEDIDSMIASGEDPALWLKAQVIRSIK